MATYICYRAAYPPGCQLLYTDFVVDFEMVLPGDVQALIQEDDRAALTGALEYMREEGWKRANQIRGVLQEEQHQPVLLFEGVEDVEA